MARRGPTERIIRDKKRDELVDRLTVLRIEHSMLRDKIARIAPRDRIFHAQELKKLRTAVDDAEEALDMYDYEKKY